MKRNISMAVFAAMIFTFAISGQAQLATNDFDLPAGSLLTNNGWAAHSGAGTNALAVVSPGLTYANFPGSGIGNAAGFVASGEDAHRTFAVQSSGSVYAAFMVNLSSATAEPVGGYFFHLSPDPIGTAFRGRVFAKVDANNNVAFGLSKAGTSEATVAFTPFSYALNTTHLIVLKYTIVDGATNDTVTMYVNPVLPGTEPGTPTLTAIDVTATDINPGTYAIRQGSATTHPTGSIDGIRIGTSFESVTSGSTAPVQNHVDFNGDGRTDFALVRNTGGGPGGQISWFINLNGPGTDSVSAWGIQGDSFVPVDFDGDNKSDIAVWRAVSTGQPSGNAFFYIYQSSNNTIRIEDFGQSGDVPQVSADYDGDGKADLAVYRGGASAGAQSFWYYRGSLNNPGGNITYVQWGQNGDFPAPGDYDGDGKNDFVVQRNNGGGQARFWMLQTTAGFETVVFGTPTDVIVPGDYDGDGRTDIAVIRGSAGQINWFVRPSSTGVITGAPYAVFGLSATDFPTQGDYDGDGRTDPAIWRPSASAQLSAFWYQGSTSGAVRFSYGQNGDYPVANYNVF